MLQPLLPFGDVQTPTHAGLKGVVYTKPWVVDLLLDLVGYLASAPLVDFVAVEPAAGRGAFLVPMAKRLVASCLREGRPLTDCRGSLIACELEGGSAVLAHHAVEFALKGCGVEASAAKDLATSWIHTGDYLLTAGRLPRADFVIGNPPYIRLEEIPEETARVYRERYPTMRGRADLYVAFFEASLRQLKAGGVCGFICADRWMLNQYGAELRRLVTEGFGVEFVVGMHDAKAFDDEVNAYPAITVIRRGPQRRVIVATAKAEAEFALPGSLATVLQAPSDGSGPSPEGLTVAVAEGWFGGSEPWPGGSPARLALLRRLENRFGPLETDGTGTRVGIGVATGLDRVFITKDRELVEKSRLLPLAMALDTATGHFSWSGHYLVNPWNVGGLVDLGTFPRLRAYLTAHEAKIRARNTARRNPGAWYRTIDRVGVGLADRPKLYIPDIKGRLEPVLDDASTYPHHNLYYIVSDRWGSRSTRRPAPLGGRPTFRRSIWCADAGRLPTIPGPVPAANPRAKPGRDRRIASEGLDRIIPVKGSRTRIGRRPRNLSGRRGGVRRCRLISTTDCARPSSTSGRGGCNRSRSKPRPGRSTRAIAAK